MKRQPNTQYCLSISYGKDSLACLGAIEKLGLPLDRIIHAEVWATDDIPADLPPMVEFKKKADKIIKDRWGIEVEHYCATNKDGSKKTYEQIFYRVVNDKTLYKRERERERESRTDVRQDIYGFPLTRGAWCNSKLKITALTEAKHHSQHLRLSNQQRELVYWGTKNGRHEESKEIFKVRQAGRKDKYCLLHRNSVRRA